MKYVVLVGEGLADEPMEELSGRTPLEVSKIPHINALAKKGRVGQASFVPRIIGARSDVACLSILGYNPKDFYTGIAPLEALSRKIALTDHTVAFRCDLVTVSDDKMIDNSASYITDKEAKQLISDLNEKLGNEHVKFYADDGYKNILVINDAAQADNLDELECTPPKSVIGHKIGKFMPKGTSAETVVSLMEKSRGILESHEINRVRIDLGENPANMIWPWGQGKGPKLPGFTERYGMSGAVVSDSQYVRGLAVAAGMKLSDNLVDALKKYDFVFVYFEGSDNIYRKKDLKSKIKLIEDFDAKFVGPAVVAVEGKPHRILVASDHIFSSKRREILHGHVPFVIAGDGVEAEHLPVSEKIAAQSKLQYEEGHTLLSFFLNREK